MGEWELQVDPLGGNNLVGRFLYAIVWQFIVLVEVVLLWLVDYVEEGGVAFLVVPGCLEIGELALLFGLGMIVFWMFPLGNVTVFEAQLQQLVAPCHFVSIIVEFFLLLAAFQRIINLLFIVPHLLLSHPPYLPYP